MTICMAFVSGAKRLHWHPPDPVLAPYQKLYLQSLDVSTKVVRFVVLWICEHLGGLDRVGSSGEFVVSVLVFVFICLFFFAPSKARKSNNCCFKPSLQILPFEPSPQTLPSKFPFEPPFKLSFEHSLRSSPSNLSCNAIYVFSCG